MQIRKTGMADVETVLAIYHTAQNYMREAGNAAQWGTAYPDRMQLEADMRNGCSYVGTDAEGRVRMTFAFLTGEDPTYRRIEQGAWLNAEPYGVIHRIASDGTVQGVFAECLRYCLKQTGNIRIDTHKNNRKMRYLLQKYGFTECGIIFTHDGTQRIAYQRTAQRGADGSAKEMV